MTTLLAGALLALTACARAESPTGAPAVHPALWVVRDADTTIYLFGTVHILRPGMNWFGGTLKRAFGQADELVLEMVEPEPAQMAGLVARLAFNPDGPTTSDQLTPEDRARFIAAAEKEQFPWRTYDRFDPWLVAVTLSSTPLKRLGYDSAAGAEQYLSQAARARAMPIRGLETAEQQLGYFDALSPALQIRFLNSTVKDLPTLPHEFDEMLGAWSKGDTDRLAALMNMSIEETPELAKVLLHDRNMRWADWIAARMKQPGTVFIAVGAGHLAGKDSVQAVLATRGLRAVRVRP